MAKSTKPKGGSKPKKSTKRGSRPVSSRGANPRPSSKPRKISPEEIDRRLALARAAAKKQHSARQGLQPRLLEALEVLQADAAKRGYPTLLRTVFPPRTHEGKWATPWAIVGKFVFKTDVTYDDLFRIAKGWQTERLVRRVGEHRKSRIQVVYVDGETKEKLKYVMSEVGPWNLSLQRMMAECDPTDTEHERKGGYVGSLAARYGLAGTNSRIESLFVWLSFDSQKNIFGL